LDFGTAARATAPTFCVATEAGGLSTKYQEICHLPQHSQPISAQCHPEKK